MYLKNLNLYFSINNHINFFSFIIYLLPLFLIFGPAPADISITILAIYAIFVTIYYKRWDLHFTKVSTIILTFNLVIITSSLLSSDPFLSLRSSLFYSYLFYSVLFILGPL